MKWGTNSLTRCLKSIMKLLNQITHFDFFGINEKHSVSFHYKMVWLNSCTSCSDKTGIEDTSSSTTERPRRMIIGDEADS